MGAWVCQHTGNCWLAACQLYIDRHKLKYARAVLLVCNPQVTVAKQQLTDDRRHFDVVVACEDEDQEDLDVPLVSIRYK